MLTCALTAICLLVSVATAALNSIDYQSAPHTLLAFSDQANIQAYWEFSDAHKVSLVQANESCASNASSLTTLFSVTKSGTYSIPISTLPFSGETKRYSICLSEYFFSTGYTSTGFSLLVLPHVDQFEGVTTGDYFRIVGYSQWELFGALKEYTFALTNNYSIEENTQLIEAFFLPDCTFNASEFWNETAGGTLSIAIQGSDLKVATIAYPWTALQKTTTLMNQYTLAGRNFSDMRLCFRITEASSTSTTTTAAPIVVGLHRSGMFPADIGIRFQFYRDFRVHGFPLEREDRVSLLPLPMHSSTTIFLDYSVPSCAKTCDANVIKLDSSWFAFHFSSDCGNTSEITRNSYTFKAVEAYHTTVSLTVLGNTTGSLFLCLNVSNRVDYVYSLVARPFSIFPNSSTDFLLQPTEENATTTTSGGVGQLYAASFLSGSMPASLEMYTEGILSDVRSSIYITVSRSNIACDFSGFVVDTATGTPSGAHITSFTVLDTAASTMSIPTLWHLLEVAAYKFCIFIKVGYGGSPQRIGYLAEFPTPPYFVFRLQRVKNIGGSTGITTPLLLEQTLGSVRVGIVLDSDADMQSGEIAICLLIDLFTCDTNVTVAAEITSVNQIRVVDMRDLIQRLVQLHALELTTLNARNFSELLLPNSFFVGATTAPLIYPTTEFSICLRDTLVSQDFFPLTDRTLLSPFSMSFAGVKINETGLDALDRCKIVFVKGFDVEVSVVFEFNSPNFPGLQEGKISIALSSASLSCAASPSEVFEVTIINRTHATAKLTAPGVTGKRKLCVMTTWRDNLDFSLQNLKLIEPVLSNLIIAFISIDSIDSQPTGLAYKDSTQYSLSQFVTQTFDVVGVGLDLVDQMTLLIGSEGAQFTVVVKTPISATVTITPDIGGTNYLNLMVGSVGSNKDTKHPIATVLIIGIRSIGFLEDGKKYVYSIAKTLGNFSMQLAGSTGTLPPACIQLRNPAQSTTQCSCVTDASLTVGEGFLLVDLRNSTTVLRGIYDICLSITAGQYYLTDYYVSVIPAPSVIGTTSTFNGGVMTLLAGTTPGVDITLELPINGDEPTSVALALYVVENSQLSVTDACTDFRVKSPLSPVSALEVSNSSYLFVAPLVSENSTTRVFSAQIPRSITDAGTPPRKLCAAVIPIQTRTQALEQQTTIAPVYSFPPNASFSDVMAQSAKPDVWLAWATAQSNQNAQSTTSPSASNSTTILLSEYYKQWFTFDLDVILQIGTMFVEGVEINSAPEVVLSVFQQIPTNLSITVSSALSSQGTVTVEMYYHSQSCANLVASSFVSTSDFLPWIVDAQGRQFVTIPKGLDVSTSHRLCILSQGGFADIGIPVVPASIDTIDDQILTILGEGNVTAAGSSVGIAVMTGSFRNIAFGGRNFNFPVGDNCWGVRLLPSISTDCMANGSGIIDFTAQGSGTRLLSAFSTTTISSFEAMCILLNSSCGLGTQTVVTKYFKTITPVRFLNQLAFVSAETLPDDGQQQQESMVFRGIENYVDIVPHNATLLRLTGKTPFESLALIPYGNKTCVDPLVVHELPLQLQITDSTTKLFLVVAKELPLSAYDVCVRMHSTTATTAPGSNETVESKGKLYSFGVKMTALNLSIANIPFDDNTSISVTVYKQASLVVEGTSLDSMTIYVAITNDECVSPFTGTTTVGISREPITIRTCVGETGTLSLPEAKNKSTEPLNVCISGYPRSYNSVKQPSFTLSFFRSGIFFEVADANRLAIPSADAQPSSISTEDNRILQQPRLEIQSSSGAKIQTLPVGATVSAKWYSVFPQEEPIDIHEEYTMVISKDAQDIDFSKATKPIALEKAVFGYKYVLNFSVVGDATVNWVTSHEVIKGKCRSERQFGKMYTSICDDCPAFATCDGSMLFTLQFSRWRANNATTKFYDCDKPYGVAACLGDTYTGTCEEGHSGPRCTTCLEGYGKALDQCVKCPSLAESISIVIIAIFVVIFIVLFMVWSSMDSKKDDRFPIFIKILLTHLTVASTVGEFTTQLPKLLISLFESYGRASRPNPRFASVDCSINPSYYARYIFVCTIPLIALLFTAFIALGVFVKRTVADKKHEEEKLEREKERQGENAKVPTEIELEEEEEEERRFNEELENRTPVQYVFITVLVIILFLAYPTLVQENANILKCDEIDLGGPNISDGDFISDQRSFFFYDRTIDCKSREHLTYTYLAYSFGILFALGIPIGSMLGVVALERSTEDRKLKKKILQVFTFVISGYRKSVWWWEAMIMLRKALIVFIVVFINDQTLQTYCAMWTMVLLLAIHNIAAPYVHRLNDVLESSSMTVIFLTLNLSLLYAYLPFGSSNPWEFWGNIGLTIFLFTVNVLFVAVLAILILKEVLKKIQVVILEKRDAIEDWGSESNDPESKKKSIADCLIAFANFKIDMECERDGQSMGKKLKPKKDEIENALVAAGGGYLGAGVGGGGAAALGMGSGGGNIKVKNKKELRKYLEKRLKEEQERKEANKEENRLRRRIRKQKRKQLEEARKNGEHIDDELSDDDGDLSEDTDTDTSTGASSSSDENAHGRRQERRRRRKAKRFEFVKKELAALAKKQEKEEEEGEAQKEEEQQEQKEEKAKKAAESDKNQSVEKKTPAKSSDSRKTSTTDVEAGAASAQKAINGKRNSTTTNRGRKSITIVGGASLEEVDNLEKVIRNQEQQISRLQASYFDVLHQLQWLQQQQQGNEEANGSPPAEQPSNDNRKDQAQQELTKSENVTSSAQPPSAPSSSSTSEKKGGGVSPSPTTSPALAPSVSPTTTVSPVPMGPQRGEVQKCATGTSGNEYYSDPDKDYPPQSSAVDAGAAAGFQSTTSQSPERDPRHVVIAIPAASSPPPPPPYDPYSSATSNPPHANNNRTSNGNYNTRAVRFSASPSNNNNNNNSFDGPTGTSDSRQQPPWIESDIPPPSYSSSTAPAPAVNSTQHSLSSQRANKKLVEPTASTQSGQASSFRELMEARRREKQNQQQVTETSLPFPPNISGGQESFSHLRQPPQPQRGAPGSQAVHTAAATRSGSGGNEGGFDAKRVASVDNNRMFVGGAQAKARTEELLSSDVVNAPRPRSTGQNVTSTQGSKYATDQFTASPSEMRESGPGDERDENEQEEGSGSPSQPAWLQQTPEQLEELQKKYQSLAERSVLLGGYSQPQMGFSARPGAAAPARKEVRDRKQFLKGDEM